jgi:hypothetical protein
MGSGATTPAKYTVIVAAFAAMLVILGGMADRAEAAWVCRKVDGKRNCGPEQTVPRDSAVPAPGISPTGQPPAKTTGVAPRPGCHKKGGLWVCP